MIDGIVDSVYKGLKKVTSVLFAPLEDLGTTEGLTQKNLQALLQVRGVSDFLMYRYYEENEDIGIYTMNDGRKGFILKLEMPGFSGAFMEEQIGALFNILSTEGIIIHMNTFVSQNILKQVEAFRQGHPCNINIKNQEALKEIIKARADSMLKWSKESMISGFDFRLKEFINTISFVYPEDTDIESILSDFDKIRASLSSVVYTKNMPSHELISLIREFFHNDKSFDEWFMGKDSQKMINHQIVSGGVSIKTNDPEFPEGYVINEKTYVTTLTTKEFPHTISMQEFNDFFFDLFGSDLQPPIFGPFMASIVIIFDGVEAARNKATSKLRHDLSELSKLPNKTIMQHPVFKERFEEADMQLKAITMDHEIPLKSMWSLTLFDSDKRKIRQSMSNIQTKFLKKGWRIIPEDFGNIALFSTLFSLPLQYNKEVEKHLKRFNVLFKSNNTAIAPLIGDDKGFGGEHIPYFGRSGQLKWFDPYASDSNYNIAAMGYSGSGKSYTMADFITMSLAKGYKIRVIDSLPSYKRLCSLFGGQYQGFTEEENVCLNFFTDMLTKKDFNTNQEIMERGEDGQLYPIIAEEDISTIVPIIGMMCGVNIVASGSTIAADVNTGVKTRYLSSRFEEAIRISFKSRGRNAGMKEVRDYLKEIYELEKRNDNKNQASILQDIITSLYSYSDPSGAYYSYFNGTNNMNFNLDFAVIELTKIEEKGDLYPIALMVIANQIVNEFYSELNRPKALIIDEFWKFIDNSIVISFTEELARKIRKMNGMLVTITQSIADYFKNDRVIALYENANWKMMLKQPTSSIDMASNSKRLSLGPFLLGLIKSVTKRSGMFGEFALVTEDRTSIMRLKTDSLSHWIYTTHPNEKNMIANAMQQYNIDELHAAKFLARRSDEPEISDDEILIYIGVLNPEDIQGKVQEEKEVEKRILKSLKKSIRIESPILYSQAVYDKNESIIYEEVLLREELKDGTIVAPQLIFKIARENGLVVSLELAVLKRAIKYYKNKYFSINLSLETLLNVKALEEIRYTIREHNANEHIILEMTLKKVTSELKSKVEEAILFLKEANIKIANDNIDIHTSPENFIAFPVDILKLDGSVIKNIVEDEVSRTFVQVIILMARKFNIKVCFIHIEDENLYNYSKQFDCDFLQGNYMSVAKRIV